MQELNSFFFTKVFGAVRYAVFDKPNILHLICSFQIFLTCMALASVTAKPNPLEFFSPVAYNAPIVASAPAVVTATSSQVFARNYNGLAAPLVAAATPLISASAPLAYSAYSSYSPLSYSYVL